MLNLLDVFASFPIWNRCFICYCSECLYMFELKSMQLKCTINIILFYFYVFTSIVCWQKRLLWWKVYSGVPSGLQSTPQHQAHLSNVVLHKKIYSLYSNIFTTLWMPRPLRMQTQLLTVDMGYAGIVLYWWGINSSYKIAGRSSLHLDKWYSIYIKATECNQFAFKVHIW